MDARLPFGHRLARRSSTARIAGGPRSTELVVAIKGSGGLEKEFWDSIETRKTWTIRNVRSSARNASQKWIYGTTMRTASCTVLSGWATCWRPSDGCTRMGLSLCAANL
jgi:hypothetical protein